MLNQSSSVLKHLDEREQTIKLKLNTIEVMRFLTLWQVGHSKGSVSLGALTISFVDSRDARGLGDFQSEPLGVCIALTCIARLFFWRKR